MLVTGRRVGGASERLHYNCDVVTFMRGFQWIDEVWSSMHAAAPKHFPMGYWIKEPVIN